MEFTGQKILICTPAYAFIEAETERCIDELYEFSKYQEGKQINEIDRFWLHGSTVAWFRNGCVKEFLAHSKKYEYLLFIDRDMVFKPEWLKTLFEVGKDIVGGMYCFRKMNIENQNLDKIVAALRTRPDGKKTVCTVDEIRRESTYLDENRKMSYKPMKVDVLGMGLTLIKRKVFETIPFPWYAQPPDEDKNTMGAWGEDRYFCTKAQESGFEIWLHPGLDLIHIGKSFSRVIL